MHPQPSSWMNWSPSWVRERDLEHQGEWGMHCLFSFHHYSAEHGSSDVCVHVCVHVGRVGMMKLPSYLWKLQEM